MNEQNVTYPYDGVSLSNRGQQLIHAVTWMSLKNLMLNEKSQTQKTDVVWFHVKTSMKGKFIKTEKRWMVAWGWEQGLTANSKEETRRDDGNVLRLGCGDGRTTL